MGSLDFYIEYNIEVPNIGEDFTLEAGQRLRDLTADHSDLLGAAVSIESLVKAETPHRFQVRIVVYKRPENIAVVEKGPDPMSTLRNALDAIEKNVRDSREKLAQADPHRGEDLQTISHELSAEEVYGTYVEDIEPEELINQGRTGIANSLMIKEGLNQDAAYFAADQILRVAQRKIDSQ